MTQNTIIRIDNIKQDIMKRKIILIVPIIVLLSLTVFFWIKTLSVDRQLFYYGQNHYKHNISLPFEMKPEYWGYDRGKLGFVLLDGDGIVARVYAIKPDIIVDSFLSYGFSDKLLVALIKATNQQKYYVIYKDARVVKILSDEDGCIDLSQEFKDLQWIDVTDKNAIKLKQNERNTYFVLGVFSFLLLIIYISVMSFLWYKKKKYNTL